jgi:hypothetical protein
MKRSGEGVLVADDLLDLGLDLFDFAWKGDDQPADAAGGAKNCGA